MSIQLDQQTLEQFQGRGVAVLRGLFTEWVDVLRAGVATNMAEPNPSARIYKDEEGGGRFFVDYCSWQRIAEYRDFIFRSSVAEVGAQLMGSDNVQLFHEHVLVKEAKADFPTPWHHDIPYYCVDGPKTVSLWLPLDDVPRERSPEFLAGSHLWNKRFRPQRFNGQPLNEDDGLEEIPDIDNSRENYDIVGWDLAPGDAIAFDFRTVHGAPANNSASAQRRAFSLRLVGDDVRFARREGITTSPPFEQVQLKHGDPLVAEEFPMLLQQRH